jgi:hypothetical protein
VTVTRFIEPPRRPARPLKLHRSMHVETVNDNNEGFLEGVCHVIDELMRAGRHDVAEDMIARLFVKADGGAT